MSILLTTAYFLSTLSSLIGAFLLACMLAWGFNWPTLTVAALALFSGARLHASMRAYYRRHDTVRVEK